MKYIDIAQTAEDLIKILEQLPPKATITINSAGHSSTVEVWYDELTNDIEII